MNSRSVSWYDGNGRITSSFTAPEDMVQINLDLRPGDPWVEGDWYAQDVYVSYGEVLPRPANPARLDGLTLTDLPTPGVIHIGTASYPYDEPTVELEFAYPGTYTVRVEAWPHLDKEFEVENPPH